MQKWVNIFTFAYSQADRKGGGAAPLAQTVSKCGNVDPFLAMKYDSFIAIH